MWFEHLQTVQQNRKRGASKAAKTRKQRQLDKRRENQNSEVGSVIFSAVVNWYIFSNLLTRLKMMVSFAIYRCAKFAKVKIQMMTKNRSFGSSVTHVTFGTTKLVL